jgi:ABC-2 type transport system permease protein
VRRIWTVAVKETIEVVRDPTYLLLAFFVPGFLMTIFGFGLSLDVEDIPLAVYDRDQTALSREYIDSYTGGGYFRIVERVSDDRQIDHALQSGGARAVLVIPDQFEKHAYRNDPVQTQLLIDGALPHRADIIRGYSIGAHQSFYQRLADRAASRSGRSRSAAPLTYRERVWFNEDIDSKHFIVPGLIATNLMFFPALLTVLSIVREKESESIVAFYNSPASRLEFIMGKLLPYYGIAMINYFILVGIGIWLFNMPFRGSLWALTLAAMVYVYTTSSIGLLMSVLVRTQVSATLITMVATMIPSFLYSGFFMPLPTMGTAGRITATCMPVTYFLEVCRGVTLKGLGLSFYWHDFIILALMGTGFYVLALMRFKKRLG